MADKVNVFSFMVVRPPELRATAPLSAVYINDEVFGDGGLHHADLFSVTSTSKIGRLVYLDIFCADMLEERSARISDRPAGRNLALVSRVLLGLDYYEPPCPNEGPIDGRDLESVLQRSYIPWANRFYLPPDRPEHLTSPLAGVLPDILALARTAAASEPPEDFDPGKLTAAICKRLDVPDLRRVVFDDGRTVAAFAATKRELFDALYVLYILRRRFSVTLEHIIDALRMMHLLEALAIDEALAEFRRQAKIGANDQSLFIMLTAVFPSLRNWKFGALPADLPLVESAADLQEYLGAAPVVPLIIARLHFLLHPFNPIQPIGVGDLKVVKQWLTKYKEGEIAHIDNVLLGESKTRVHRRLEKTEETFSFSSEQEQETTRDTQTTDRFELKRETDNVIKTDTSVTAGLSLNLTYSGTGYQVMTGVTGGMAYARSQTDQTKTSGNFARDVVDKAVKRLQNKTSQQRSTTKLFETEETNTHTFENKLPGATKHVSGIYRWVDKEYTAQLFNYGKRMMFEFVIPEPAEFLVESRMRAFESRLDYPRPPKKPDPVQLPDWLRLLNPATISEQRYRELAETYDLSELPFPVQRKVVDLVNSESGKALFSEQNVPGGGTYTAYQYVCKLSAVGYRITRCILRGHLVFAGAAGQLPGLPDVISPTDLPEPATFTGGPPGPPAPWEKPAAGEINRFELTLNGDQVLQLTDNRKERWYFTAGQLGTDFAVNGSRLTQADVTLMLGFWDGAAFSLAARVELEYTAQAMAEWQYLVRGAIVKVEQAKVEAANQELTQAYNAQLATYRNRLAELRAAAINDLLQGESEAANRQMMLRELKRQCLAMITKEFDAVTQDDVFTDFDAMGVREIDFKPRQFQIQETPNSDFPTQVTGEFKEVPKPFDARMINIDAAKIKGRYVQFLEQAFEWQLLSYVLYPYFWAIPPQWVTLMNRSDATDPFLSSFLQAGSVRVLVAVTPAYDEAVLHYLATGEPWEAGPSPVIGDPLFIPLYEELKRQQDDLAGAVAEGPPWTFTLPTSLVYLSDSTSPLPAVP